MDTAHALIEPDGMTDGLLTTTTLGNTTIAMFALTMADQQAATAVAQTIAATQNEVSSRQMTTAHCRV